MVTNDQLAHHGVKGMKWGVRKTRKWATSKHAPSSVRSSVLAGVYAATGSEKVGKALDKSNDKDYKDWQRAKDDYKSMTNKESKKQKENKNSSKLLTKERAARVVAKGAEVATKLAVASAVDDMFYGGMGKKVVKETVKQTGRAAVTAFMMANGAYDIRWFDNGILD